MFYVKVKGNACSNYPRCKSQLFKQALSSMQGNIIPIDCIVKKRGNNQLLNSSIDTTTAIIPGKYLTLVTTQYPISIALKPTDIECIVKLP